MSSISKSQRDRSKRYTRVPLPDWQDAGRHGAGRASGTASTAVMRRATPARVDHALRERFADADVEITAENLPVLNAFNEFLDIERRTARRRFRGMFWMFLLLLLASLTTALAVGWGIARRLESEWESEMSKANEQRHTLAGELSAVASTASEDLQKQLEVRDRAVRHTYRTLADYISVQTNTVEHILYTMTALEREISSLDRQLRELTQETGAVDPRDVPVMDQPSDAPDLDGQMEQDFALMRRLMQQRMEQVAIERDDPSHPRDVRDAGDTSAPLTIQTPSGRAVPWRF